MRLWLGSHLVSRKNYHLLLWGKKIANAILVLFFGCMVQAQDKVANYSFGTAGTAQYEHLSFRVKDGRRAQVEYAYGAERKESTVKYIGRTNRKGQTGFAIQFPNKYKLYINPEADRLRVADSSGKYRKTFVWEYEGPVNGIGTFCDVCAQDETEAMKIVKGYFVK